jgi:hypothetical protein
MFPALLCPSLSCLTWRGTPKASMRVAFPCRNACNPQRGSSRAFRVDHNFLFTTRCASHGEPVWVQKTNIVSLRNFLVKWVESRHANCRKIEMVRAELSVLGVCTEPFQILCTTERRRCAKSRSVFRSPASSPARNPISAAAQ